MIVKNEERMIERALACARPICDEMIVVDTGSTDRTVELAEAMGARVFNFPWIDDFAAARNASFDHCTCDWIMWLDADDIITEENQQKILQQKEAGMPDWFNVIVTSYNVWLGIHHEQMRVMRRERLIRRGSGLRWQHAVHENIDHPTYGTNYRYDIAIDHRSDETTRPERTLRNRRLMELAIEGGADHFDILKNYAIDLFDQGRWEEAAAYFLKARERRPNSHREYDILHSLSMCARYSGDLEQSLRWATEAAAYDNTQPDGHVMIALYHVDRMEWTDAIIHLTAATECNWEDRRESPYVRPIYFSDAPWDLLAQCYERVGDIAGAERCRARIAEIQV